MKISVERVKVIADATKINIPDDELVLYQKQLNAIQDVMDNILSLELEGVLPRHYNHYDEMILREDVCVEFEEVAIFEDKVIETKDHYVKVPKVL